MPLSAQIEALRDRVLAELVDAHDYFTDTKIAWGIVGEAIAEGHSFSVDNRITGTVTTQTVLAGKARGYVAEQLAEATFQQFISIFENFFFDLLRLWLTAYPQSLGAKKLDFQTVLDSPDKDAITQRVVSKTYLSKAGNLARHRERQRIDIPEQYHRETWELVRKIIADISNAAMAKC